MTLETFHTVRDFLYHWKGPSLFALGWLFEVLRCCLILAHIDNLGRLNHTFEMKKDIGLIILEHLSYQLDVHVLDIDLLDAVNAGQI